MLRRLLNRYREARRAHPRLTDYAWGVVYYCVVLLWYWSMRGIDSWMDYLWPLLFVIAFLTTASLFRRDRGGRKR